MPNPFSGLLALSLLLLAGCVGVVGEGDEFPESGSIRQVSEVPPSCPGPSEPPLALGLRINTIALYQTVRIDLYRDGQWILKRAAPPVQGKRALVRVFVDALPDYERHRVRAVLRLQSGSLTRVFTDERAVTESSRDEDAASTFNFEVDGTAIGDDTKTKVTLEELDCDAESGAAEVASFPPGERMVALQAEKMGTLRLVVVPIRVGKRVPRLDPAEILSLRKMLLAYYPVPQVEVSVRKEITWPADASLEDLSDLLTHMTKVRAGDRQPADVYYMGLVQPADTLVDHCGKDCVIGLARVPIRADPSMQAGAALYFGDLKSRETVVHEVGHMHGLGHAPCGTRKGIDPQYPHPMGVIGTEQTGNAWDSRTRKLVPWTVTDVMGYCKTNWISAYNYDALARRSREVNSLGLALVQRSPLSYREVLVYDSGATRWTGLARPDMPAGEVARARVLDAAGRELTEVEVAWVPLSHGRGGYLYVPEPGPEWATLVLPERQLTLGTIQAPL